MDNQCLTRAKMSVIEWSSIDMLLPAWDVACCEIRWLRLYHTVYPQWLLVVVSVGNIAVSRVTLVRPCWTFPGSSRFFFSHTRAPATPSRCAPVSAVSQCAQLSGPWPCLTMIYIAKWNLPHIFLLVKPSEASSFVVFCGLQSFESM